MTERQGHLGNPKAQDKLRQMERDFHALEDADAESLLRTDWGRRIAMRMVYAVGRLDSLSLEPNAGVKDGVAMAILTGRNEGLREAGRLYGEQFKRVNQELWILAHAEKWAADAQEGAKRAEAESTPSGEG